jgi:hypothetical protein
MESLFLLAFAEQEYLAALAMAGSESFFNKLLMLPVQPVDATPSSALIRHCFRERTICLAALGQTLARAAFRLV